ncbi:MAG: hypothetical protein LBM25_07915 [Bacteroidales bacterium]|jgi:hypothetical protein|nr:hypothetical protein [Bacteroidales bacterium]
MKNIFIIALFSIIFVGFISCEDDATTENLVNNSNPLINYKDDEPKKDSVFTRIDGYMSKETVDRILAEPDYNPDCEVSTHKNCWGITIIGYNEAVISSITNLYEDCFNEDNSDPTPTNPFIYDNFDLLDDIFGSELLEQVLNDELIIHCIKPAGNSFLVSFTDINDEDNVIYYPIRLVSGADVKI